MSKSFLIIIGAVMFWLPFKTNGQPANSEGLLGKVTSITSTEYLTTRDTDGTIKKGKELTVLHQTQLFNSNGNLTERVPFSNDDHSPRFVYTYTYNTDSTLLTTTWWHGHEHGVSQHNKKGLVTEIAVYKADGSLFYKNAYAYDYKDRKIRLYYLYPGPKYLFQSYVYDDKNLLVKEIDYNKDGSVNYNVYFKYTSFDDHGNWTAYIRYGNFVQPQYKNTIIKPTITERTINYAK